MAETKRNDELRVRIDPRLITRIEEYAAHAGTGVDFAVMDLLEAGLKRQDQRPGPVRGRKPIVRTVGQ